MIYTFSVQYNFWLLDNQLSWMELEIQTKRNEIYIINENSSDLQWVKEVEDRLQERTEDNADCTGHEEGDDTLVGIVLLSSSSDGLHQKLMSVNDVDTWV